ncbi:MAG: hypothetical protein AUK03_02875 [Anaerolineae bacterium CG2_30_64_16]|nr:MAG: hypothetical protein AUK03_02875 [Anaerolineae bacterium CG2_30_64_16]
MFQIQGLDDVRESPALDVIELLRAKGADVRYHDPYVPCIRHNGFEMAGETDLDTALAAADCVVVVTDHSSYAWVAIRKKVRLVVDTRNAMDQVLRIKRIVHRNGVRDAVCAAVREALV